LWWRTHAHLDLPDAVLHIHALREGICAVSITDTEYPSHVAQALCRKVANEFSSKYPKTAYANATIGGPQLPYPELKDYITRYQNPEEADNIAKIKKELDETKVIMKDTIESLLERGEKIDNLVAKSDGLSAQSKMFYTQVRKLRNGTTRAGLLTAERRPRSRTLAALSCEYEIKRLDCCTAFTFGFVFERRYVPFAYPMNMSRSRYIWNTYCTSGSFSSDLLTDIC